MDRSFQSVSVALFGLLAAASPLVSAKDGSGNPFLATNLTCHLGAVVFLVVVNFPRCLPFALGVIPMGRHSVSPNFDSTKRAGHLLFLENRSTRLDGQLGHCGSEFQDCGSHPQFVVSEIQCVVSEIQCVVSKSRIQYINHVVGGSFMGLGLSDNSWKLEMRLVELDYLSNHASWLRFFLLQGFVGNWPFLRIGRFGGIGRFPRATSNCAKKHLS